MEICISFRDSGWKMVYLSGIQDGKINIYQGYRIEKCVSVRESGWTLFIYQGFRMEKCLSIRDSGWKEDDKLVFHITYFFL